MHKDTDTATAARPYPQHPGEATQPAHRPFPGRSPTTTPEFPGCRPMPLRHRDLDHYEGRFEYWDRDTEIAWVCEPTSPAHELPSHGLAGLLELIAAVRGSPIRCYGTMDLELRDERGERWRILQADQSVYLHPGRVELVGSRAMVVGRHNPPDVVLEVDHTTDVRRGKKGLYEEWGFPELWVEVPESTSASRPASRRPGLTIYRLEGGVYREAPQSVAFAGWSAEEIHGALNEGEMSEESSAVLERVGRALGEREGTGPDDLPWLRSQRRQARAEGHAEGRAGTLEAFARRVLASRGIGGDALRIDPGDVAGVSDEAVCDALMQCEDAADFRARLRGLRR